MAFSNSANPTNEHLYGSTHGGSDNMPFLPEGARCCQYRTFIFKSKNPEKMIFGHTPDCNMPQSLLDCGSLQFFAVYPNGPFEGSHPVMETDSNPPILRRTPKWADDGKPIYWYVDLKEKTIKDLLHPLAVQKYEKEKKQKGAGKGNDKKEGKTSEGEKKYVHNATQTEDKQPALEKKDQSKGDEKKVYHTKFFNADGEDVTGSARRPRRTTRAEDELRPQLQPLRIWPYHGEDNCEVDDPDYYDRQQRRSELDHLAMDSGSTLLAGPPQSYDPRSPREARHHMRSYLRPLKTSNYNPPRVELHQENHDPNESTAQQDQGLRGGALIGADEISDDGETIVFRERNCRRAEYMVHGYGQPHEAFPLRYHVICGRHDPNLQNKQARETWIEKDMTFMGLRGGASQANASQVKAAEEKHKREVSREHDRMSFGDYAPVPTIVYENKPKEDSAPAASQSPEKHTDNGNGQSTSMGLRGGGMDGCDERSEASEDTWRTESTSLSELFEKAKEIKAIFENSGPKTGRPQPAQDNNRLRVTSFIEALQNPFAEAGSSLSTDCARCVNLTNQRLRRWEKQALGKTIKEMQRESNRMGIRPGQIAAEKGEVEGKEEKVMMKERALNEQKMLSDAVQDSSKLGFRTRGGATRDLGTEDAQHSTRTSMIQPTSAGDRFARQRDLPTETISPDKLDMLLQVLQDWKKRPARLQKDFDDLKDELATELGRRDIYTDKSICSEDQAARLEKENFELQRQLQIHNESTQQRMNFPQQGHQPAIYGLPTGWLPGSTNQQYIYEIISGEHFNSFWGNVRLPGPLNYQFSHQGFSPQAEHGGTGPHPTQSFQPVQISAMPMFICSSRSFKPQSSDEFLKDGGPDPEEFISSRQQRQSDGSKATQPQAAFKRQDKKEDDQVQSQTWTAQALKDAEQEEVAEQKKQEKDAEEERKNQKQAWDRSMGWHY